MRTQLKLFLALTAILMFIQIAHATEITARVKNYDHWKDLPSETLFNMVNEFWPANKEDSALICCLILSNRYNNNLSNAEKRICCGASLGELVR